MKSCRQTKCVSLHASAVHDGTCMQVYTTAFSVCASAQLCMCVHACASIHGVAVLPASSRCSAAAAASLLDIVYSSPRSLELHKPFLPSAHWLKKRGEEKEREQERIYKSKEEGEILLTPSLKSISICQLISQMV